MAGFLDWFFAFLTTMIDGIWMIFSGIFGGIFKIFNIVDYMAQFNSYKGGFGVIDWILAIFSFVLVIGIENHVGDLVVHRRAVGQDAPQNPVDHTAHGRTLHGSCNVPSLTRAPISKI